MTRAAVPTGHEPPRAARRRARGAPAKRHPARPRAPRVPEPGEILDSPGRPLDPGLRREMETRLGHDFSQVLIHTDRDSAMLAELLGADAVTVGQDVFFADGTYQPWSAGGRRLLAHELLHTVQSPHPPGALRAGRDAGAVSLPHEPLERDAEREAQRSGEEAGAATADREPELRAQGPMAAGWLRYATVTAEQQRIEQLDPATLVDRLVAGVLRSLRGDPVDSSKRVRLQLARLGEELRSSVLDKLEVRLPTADHRQVVQAATDLEENAAPLPVDSAPAPESVAVPDPQGEQSARDEVRGSEGEQARQRDQDAAAEQQHAREEQDKAAAREGEQAAEAGKRQQDEAKAAEQEKAGTQAAAADAEKKTAQDEQRQDEKAGQQQKEAAETESAEKEKASAKEEKQRAEQAGAAKEAGGPVAAPAPRQGPIPGTQPVVAPPAGAGGGIPPADLDRVDAIAEEPGGPLARHRLTAKPGKTDEQQPAEVPPGEQPEGLEADPAGQVSEAEGPAPNLPELPPQQPVPPGAYLPKQDLDTSGIPTAEEIKLPASGAPPPTAAAPSFPAPPEPEVRPERPGEPDPVEKRLQEQDRREGATIETAPGQVGPDAAEQEPDTAPGPAGGGPGPEPVAGATAEPGPAGSEAAGAGMTAVRPAGGVAPVEAAGGNADAGGEAVPEGPGKAAPGAAAQVPQDASLEAGGGACAGAPEPPAPVAGQGGGGCGGGAPPTAAPEAPQPAAPDVSQQEPQAALATVGQLPPTVMLSSLDGVDAAASNNVGQEREQLAQSPPQLERPSGAPQTLHGPPYEAAPASYDPDKVQRASPESKGEQDRPEDKTVTGSPTPAEQVQAPKVTGDQGGKITEADVQNIEEAVDSVPTTDPVLDQASVGVAPTVALSGETDPVLTDQQQASLRDKSAKILAAGRDDAARPLGENQIYPDVPDETLKARVPAAQPAAAAAPTGTASGPAAAMTAGGAAAPGPGAAGDQAISAVAQQERGPQIQAAVGQGQSQMAAGQENKQRDEERAQEEHRTQVAAAIKVHADQEAAERAGTRDQGRGQRLDWQREQSKLVADADAEAVRKHDKARDDISVEKAGTDRKIGERQQEENNAIAEKRREAEQEARDERDKNKDSDGWLDKLASAVKDAFNALISKIKDVFAAARKFVQDVINRFKDFVTGLIDAARKAIVGLINKLADALIALGDGLLAAFPGLRDKFRALIEDARDQAIRNVNKIADDLKSAVSKLLDQLAKTLTDLLDGLEKALSAAVAFIRDAVVGAINFVKNAIALLGEFAAIIADVAIDPGGWLSKLGNAVMDGIRYCLWDAIKAAVKQWFSEKVQAILGLGQLIINVLIKGCISLAKIARMAWDALIKALPAILIQVAIDVLLKVLVPGAGAIMAIVQGAIAAYHAISKIIAAIGKFVTFLKGVRSGQGARLFAEAVAAGVVALLEFIASYLLSKLGDAAKGVASKLKGIADRLLKLLARGAKAVKKGIGTAFNAAKRGAKAAAGAVKRGFHAVARAGKSGARWLGKQAKAAMQAIGRGARALGRRLAKTKLGKFVGNIGNKIKTKYQQAKAKLAEWREKFRKWREDRKKNKPTPEQRLEAAVERIRPIVAAMLHRGVRRTILRAALFGMRLWYRLSGLAIEGESAFSIRAWINPETVFISGVEFNARDLVEYIHRLADAVIAVTTENGGSNLVERTKADVRTGRGLTPQDEATVPVTRQRELIEVRPGARAQDVYAEMAKDPKASPGIRSTIRFFDEGEETSHDVLRRQGGRRQTLTDPDTGLKRTLITGDNPENQLVLMKDPKTNRLRALRYSELSEKIAGTDSARQRILAAKALMRLRGAPPTGENALEANQLSTWIVLTEARRNPAALVTSALALDAVARKPGLDLAHVINRLPMSQEGAQAQARALNKALGEPGKRPLEQMPAAARTQARLEFGLVRLWAEHLQLLTDNTTTHEELRQRLIAEIRERIFSIYALTPREREAVMAKMGSQL
jgi:phage-related protein